MGLSIGLFASLWMMITFLFTFLEYYPRIVPIIGIIEQICATPLFDDMKNTCYFDKAVISGMLEWQKNVIYYSMISAPPLAYTILVANAIQMIYEYRSNVCSLYVLMM
jgi:hypothetical protein